MLCSTIRVVLVGLPVKKLKVIILTHTEDTIMVDDNIPVAYQNALADVIKAMIVSVDLIESLAPS